MSYLMLVKAPVTRLKIPRSRNSYVSVPHVAVLAVGTQSNDCRNSIVAVEPGIECLNRIVFYVFEDESESIC